MGKTVSAQLADFIVESGSFDWMNEMIQKHIHYHLYENEENIKLLKEEKASNRFAYLMEKFQSPTEFIQNARFGGYRPPWGKKDGIKVNFSLRCYLPDGKHFREVDVKLEDGKVVGTENRSTLSPEAMSIVSKIVADFYAEIVRKFQEQKKAKKQSSN